MTVLVRRSNLMVPITNPRFIAGAWRHGADAITLDLEDGVVDARKAEARGLVRQAIGEVGRSAVEAPALGLVEVPALSPVEVFVRVNKPFAQADIEASVWPGLRGIMLPRVESAAEVREASQILTTLEQHRGIEVGSLQLILLLESARGVWDIRRIIAASPRVTQVGLDESDLSADLGIRPLPELDPCVYARGRLAIEATAAGVQPIGIAHPLGAHPRLLPAAEIQKIATDSKNLGFKGIVCTHPSWVQPVDAAFTPTQSQVDFYTQVRQVFTQAVAAGTAAVPFAGRMIDVPVDEWAKVVLELAAACAARDAEKQAALARLAGG